MANLKLALYVNFSYTAASPEKGLLQDGNKTRYLHWCCLTQLQFQIQDINFVSFALLIYNTPIP